MAPPAECVGVLAAAIPAHRRLVAGRGARAAHGADDRHRHRARRQARAAGLGLAFHADRARRPHRRVARRRPYHHRLQDRHPAQEGGHRAGLRAAIDVGGGDGAGRRVPGRRRHRDRGAGALEAFRQPRWRDHRPGQRRSHGAGRRRADRAGGAGARLRRRRHALCRDARRGLCAGLRRLRAPGAQHRVAERARTMEVTRRDILREATEAQRRGSDPGWSAWVSASAGSGKTKVLGDRVLRLLLGNVPPARILCLTFTKAAAAEMSNRVAERLAAWAAASDDRLREELRNLAGGGDIKALMPVARRLFARVLDTPGGMKIMTIHAFCQSLLRRFPLEAEVAPHFTLIEERDATALLGEARDEMLNAARAGNDPALRQALDTVVARMLEGRLNDLMKELFSRRARFERLIGSAEMPAIRSALRTTLRVGAVETRESVLAEAVADVACNPALLRRAADALAQGTERDRDRAETLCGWIGADAAERAARFDEYCALFFTQEGTITKNLATKGVQKAWADVKICLTAEADRLAAIRERMRAVEV